MLDPNFIYLSALLILVGDGSYLFETIKGRVKPNRVTWLLWGLAPIVIYFAQLSKGVGFEAYLTLVIGAVPILIFVATFFNKKAYWKLTRFDYTFAVLSVIGLIAWYFTKDGNLAIFLILIADVFASIPTFRKAYTHPETEDYKIYLLNSIALLIALLTIRSWNFANYAYLLMSFISCLYFTIVIKFELGKRLKT